MSVNPPRPKTPHLTALRAFEAAARLGGFSAAADELGVTPGAVTAHIKGLETDLGAQLFSRGYRGVELTGLGARVLPAFTEAFDALGQAAQMLRSEAAPQTVRIAALPAIAQLWLSPRLPALRASAPDITVSIEAMEAPPNLKRAPFDLSLFYAPEGRGTALAPDVIFPVCTPSIAATLQSPEDLLHVPCITDAVWADDWAIWASRALPGQVFAPRGPVFSLYALAVQEALAGAGVLMGHEALVADHLSSGALVAPFRDRADLPRSLMLWSARPLVDGRAATIVARWLERV